MQEILQRGRGIGGLLRLVKSIFSPIVRSLGKTAVKAVTSKVGKKVVKVMKDQAISSGLNMMTDVVKGKSLKKSALKEVKVVKKKLAKGIESINPVKESNNKVKKVAVKRGNIKDVPIKYQDNSNSRDFLG